MASVICLKNLSFIVLICVQKLNVLHFIAKLSKQSYKGGLQSDTREVRANDEE